MSNTPTQDKALQRVSSTSGHTLPSRSVQPPSDPSVPKRLCFYKSGDHKFSGHRMVINGRTFKTFDALLDALSEKVPLPFGVRTISTPRGTHFVKGLDDLQDGGCYLCSDQRRVKPLNLEEVSRRQVPWNTPRAFIAGRWRRQGDGTGNRPAKVTQRVAVRTPKRLVVIRNKDPTVRRTIVLQKRTAPTFDALLDYLSQVLQFPVLKLYSVDGRRIGGLAALILCSGFIVAAGNEPFMIGNHSFHGTSQAVQAMFMGVVQASTQHPQTHNNKLLSGGRCSRNFSLSSEQYIINQINKSRNGSTDSRNLCAGSRFSSTCLEECGTTGADNEHHTPILPPDDDIEKSFRVNQDGSMTVEMKVRLTIKEEEMLHWTTTVSRPRRTVRTLVTESGNISPDSNIYVAKEPSNICKDGEKKENQPTTNEDVSFNDSQESKVARKCSRRTPTPGPCRVQKQASVESVKMLTDTGVQESTFGHYSCTKRTAEGHTAEGFCIIRQGSGTQLVPKHRKSLLKGSFNNTSFHKSTGVAEVLKIENTGLDVRETVMHIYESQGCYNNYLVNEGSGAEDEPWHCSSVGPQSNPSTASGPTSSNEIDFSRQQQTAESLQRQKEEMLSLSSEPQANSISSTSKNKTENVPPNKLQKNTDTKKASQSGLAGKKYDSSGRLTKQGTNLSTDKISSHAGKAKNGSSESAKSGLNRKVDRTNRHEKESESAFRASTEEHNKNEAAKDNGHNVNTPSVRPVMKKNVSDLLKLQRSLGSRKKTQSTNGKRLSSLELRQNVSKASLNPTPSEIHQYVENWLEDVTPDPVAYIEKATTVETDSQTKVLFQLGCDSEMEENNHTQNDPQEYYKSHCNDLTKLSPSVSLGGQTIPRGPNEQKLKGDSVLSDTFKSVHQTNCIGSNQSFKLTHLTDSESPKWPNKDLTTVLQQLCLSIQSTHKLVSPLDFSSNVASLFGSSCNAFLSFLFASAVRDILADNVLPEALLIVKSLQDISAIEDQNEQVARLTDLHSGASSELIKCWTDFQTLTENMETESLVAKVLEDKDEVCERDAFEVWGLGLDELMKELSMPYELRAEISSAIRQGTILPLKLQCNQTNHPGVESVVLDCDTESKQFFDSAHCNENPTGKDITVGTMTQSEEERVKKGGLNAEESKVLQIETDESSVDKTNVAVVKGEEDHMMENEKAVVQGEKDQDARETKLKQSEGDTEEEAMSKESEANTGQEEQSDQEEEEHQVEVADSEDVTTDKAEKEDKVEDVVAKDEEGSSEEWKEETYEVYEVEKQDEDIKEERVGDLVEMIEKVDNEKVQGENTEEVETKLIREDSHDNSHTPEPLPDEEEIHPVVLERIEKQVEDKEAEDESAEGNIAVEEVEISNQTQTQVERTDGEDDDYLREGFGKEPNEELDNTGNVSDETFRKSSQSSEIDENESLEANMEVENSKESYLKYLSDEHCEEEAANANDSFNQAQLHHQGRSNSLSHPVEISQELLDFVNSALQSSSLIFTYDDRGNIRIEPDRAGIAETKQTRIPENQRDCLYGSTCLPSPITSDLSDYRPESLDSGGYQSQDSVDIVSESSEEDSDKANLGKNSKVSMANNSKGVQREGSISSCDSTSKLDSDPLTESEQHQDPNDGVLIDQGRWLLKENHLIRNSPPVSQGMYQDLNSSSAQENSSEDSSTHLASQHTPLTVLSSSELEEMAKPRPPRCSYFTMPHGSDSDPFPEDASDTSRSNDTSSLEEQGFRVSPTIDTSKTWAKNNGSLSSFVSVEFRVPDRKVHPEVGESSLTGEVVRGTSGGRRAVLQSQDSLDASSHVRCGQYCLIL
ncbi:oxygen-regulated protein 1 [Nerophis ophidion]|uniref:oxygen-regulated protein 1 n=1 Tax=Nerophis ophidion TaxID=159077 RepID=UPI002ADF19A4|nr:oxygen-regulated protein 1 [Nerophis ophidion]